MLNESFHLPWEVKGHWEPAWRSIHTTTYDYVEWRADGRIIGREYYDLTQTPTNSPTCSETATPPTTPTLHRFTHKSSDSPPASEQDAADIQILPRAVAQLSDTPVTLPLFERRPGA